MAGKHGISGVFVTNRLHLLVFFYRLSIIFYREKVDPSPGGHARLLSCCTAAVFFSQGRR
jgi:hypothetical protein